MLANDVKSYLGGKTDMLASLMWRLRGIHDFDRKFDDETYDLIKDYMLKMASMVDKDGAVWGYEPKAKETVQRIIDEVVE